jgi:hypothetical protein
LKLKATAETYIFHCVASKLSTNNLLLYELTPMQVFQRLFSLFLQRFYD